MEPNQLTTNQNSVNPETPTPQVRSNNSLLVAISISVLLTAVVIGSVVYFWQKAVNEKAISNLEQRVDALEEQILTMGDADITPQPTPSPGLSPTPTADQTANWQTYQNSEFNFSLKYPPTWSLEELSGQVIIKSNTELTNEQLASLGIGYTSSPIPVAEFRIELNPSQSSIDITDLREFTQSTDTLEIIQKTETRIQGRPAIRYQGRGGGLEEQGVTGINIGLDNGFLRIKLSNYSGSTENQQILDRIFSTFQFAN